MRAYTESVIRDEWPTMAYSQSSPVTTRLFNHLFGGNGGRVDFAQRLSAFMR